MSEDEDGRRLTRRRRASLTNRPGKGDGVRAGRQKGIGPGEPLGREADPGVQTSRHHGLCRRLKTGRAGGTGRPGKGPPATGRVRGGLTSRGRTAQRQGRPRHQRQTAGRDDSARGEGDTRAPKAEGSDGRNPKGNLWESYAHDSWMGNTEATNASARQPGSSCCKEGTVMSKE